MIDNIFHLPKIDIHFPREYGVAHGMSQWISRIISLFETGGQQLRISLKFININEIIIQQCTGFIIHREELFLIVKETVDICLRLSHSTFKSIDIFGSSSSK